MLCVLRVKAAQVIKSREENRQRNEETIVNNEIEASDDTNGIQEQDIHENIPVCNINEEVINANQEFSAEHINIQSQFKWGDLSGEVFIQRIDIAYEEIVKWRRNIFCYHLGKREKPLFQN